MKSSNVMMVPKKVVDKKSGLFGFGEKSHFEFTLKIIDSDSMHSLNEPKCEYTNEWISPEVALYKAERRKAEKNILVAVKNSTNHDTDIYGLGLLLWEILSFEILKYDSYKDNNGKNLGKKVKYGGQYLDAFNRLLYYMTSDDAKPLRPIRPVIHEKGNQKLAGLVKRCWNEDPGARPNIDQVIEVLNGIK